MRIQTAFLIIAICMASMFKCSCDKILCGFAATSELITYRGRIIVNGDSVVNTATNIWAANYNNRIYGQDGARLNSIPQHPSRSGDFTIGGVTYSHSLCETVEQ